MLPPSFIRTHISCHHSSASTASTALYTTANSTRATTSDVTTCRSERHNEGKQTELGRACMSSSIYIYICGSLCFQSEGRNRNLLGLKQILLVMREGFPVHPKGFLYTYCSSSPSFLLRASMRGPGCFVGDHGALGIRKSLLLRSNSLPRKPWASLYDTVLRNIFIFCERRLYPGTEYLQRPRPTPFDLRKQCVCGCVHTSHLGRKLCISPCLCKSPPVCVVCCGCFAARALPYVYIIYTQYV